MHFPTHKSQLLCVFLQVLMKDVATPVPQNEVRAVIKKSLENAALVNYERLSEEARIEGESIHNNNDGSVKIHI